MGNRRRRPQVRHAPRPTAEAPTGQVAVLSRELAAERNNVELLAESIADLERQLSDPGWVRLLAQADREFTVEGLRQIRAICRVYAIKNPLIKRGLALRVAYVWGQGVQIAARATGRRAQPGEQDVNAVVQDFLGDDANARAVTGAAARTRLERALGTDGEVFLACFTRPMTGAVQARVLPADEIADVICNPDDASEPWYYRRCWTRVTHGLDGYPQYEPTEAIYPCVDYRPAARPRYFGSTPISWDSPVLHIKVNDLEGWRRGLPDAYAAIDWAAAYREFLTDWARLMRSLSRYAWKATAKGSAAAAVKARIAQAPTSDAVTGAPNAVGATAIVSPDAALEAINKSGATIDADSGRPLAMMVAAALDVPVTMLLGDPGLSGARATAETLDQPTELAMAQRRDLWAAAYQRILRYVVTEAVRAPQGALKGVIRRDPTSGREYLALAADTDATIDISWPDLDDVDPAVLVHAIVEAASTGTLPPEQIARLLLIALGVHDVDDILAELVDNNGAFLWPNAPPMTPADAQRAGQDPAATGDGPMTPDDPPPPDEPGPADQNPAQQGEQ